MPAKTRSNPPSCRRQKSASGDRAFVVLNQRRHYLGAWNSPESRQAYDRLVAQWLAGGRHLPVDPNQITIVELCSRFWQHAGEYYRRPDGTSTSSLHNFRLALRPLKRLYGVTQVADFGPMALRSVRQAMVDGRLSRGVINQLVGLIRHVFRWGVGHELVSAQTHAALTAVEPLSRGRCGARDTEPIRPVPDHLIAPLQPHLSRQVWAMIQFQLLTACRPQDVLSLRAVDLDTRGEIWTVDHAQHKNSWRGMKKVTYIGPQAQAVLRPFLANRPVDAFLFSPTEAEAERRADQHARRRTPLSCGNLPGSHRVQNPHRHPRDRYDVISYRQSIHRACDDAFPPPPELARIKVKGSHGERWERDSQWKQRLGPEKWKQLREWRHAHRWSPNRLRHNAATNLRREFGIDVAQTVLGHRLGSTVTEVYAEANVQRAMEAIRKVG